ncbi:MAG TPA: bifunctional acetate--CoA ligase family protein/GNAT family N-acetyltransferase [Candidatus Cloacimonadota bacterium]|nr:bifunctional acetate--CoA ligase family protein/GNAT family N-acetyltransferase [Candidatus Cloacimonadota bacterium]HQL14683.1 bifunctional acetate--CoA ligase family protein/GNAT family N-acetyltransferase [Candidatus Cloacimonadota bacterium]
MNVHNLDNIFKPKRIAILGIAINPQSVSGRILSNLVTGGYNGVVYPVNPSVEAVMGIQCYPDVQSLPHKPDLAVICSEASAVPEQVRECGDAGILGIIIITAGFKETGARGKKLEQEIAALRLNYPGMRIMGPNCLGFISPASKLNVSFGDGMPNKGNIAFVSQSGALCTSVLDWAIQAKIGFSHLVSIGNMLDVDFGDLIDYLGEDEETRCILLYIESISEAREFMTAARAFARSKPIIAYKAGRFPESAEVAASHTGAMAAADNVYDAAFQRAGIVRIDDIGKIFDVAELVGRKKIPAGDRLAIVTNAGGPGVMATDELIALNGTLAKLDAKTMDALNENLPESWSHGNPVDVLGDARPKRYAKAVSIVLEDPNVDAVLVILTPQAMTNPSGTAREISKLAETAKKPILAAWIGGARMEEGLAILAEANIPAYKTPEQAIGAFIILVDYGKNLRALYETPRDIPVEFSLDRAEFRKKFDKICAEGNSVLSETTSKDLLEAYGIDTTMPQAAKTAEEAVAVANKIGYPVVLKIMSPQITHKTDAGGVKLNLHSADDVRTAFRQITEQVKARFPEAEIEGVTVQPMLETDKGVELILGIKQDPVFGSVMMVGTGGIYAELFKDIALELPPLNEKLARRMLERLKIYPLLKGYRGKPPVNIDKLIEVLIRMSYLAADYPEITELDINPLLATPEKIMALDARVVINLNYHKGEAYSHLALRPYPEEYVKQVQLPDGTPLTFRPIKPEDENLWMEMLASCSKETIYQRFRYFFFWNSHEVAVRYCFIDYDREIAIVAEANENGKKKLVGVGRMVADPDHNTVEYAILVPEAWQNRRLGSMLTDFCMEISVKWHAKKMVAQTTKDNFRMLKVFRRHGFAIMPDPNSEMVDVEKELA